MASPTSGVRKVLLPFESKGRAAADKADGVFGLTLTAGMLSVGSVGVVRRGVDLPGGLHKSVSVQDGACNAVRDHLHERGKHCPRTTKLFAKRIETNSKICIELMSTVGRRNIKQIEKNDRRDE